MCVCVCVLCVACVLRIVSYARSCGFKDYQYGSDVDEKETKKEKKEKKCTQLEEDSTFSRLSSVGQYLLGNY